MTSLAHEWISHLFLNPEIPNPQDLTLLSVKLTQLWVTLSSAESLSSFFSQICSLRRSLERLQPGSGEVSSLISSSIPPGNMSSIAPGLLGAVSLPSALGTGFLLRLVLGSLQPSLGLD